MYLIVWNGFGGKVEAGEEIEQAAKREIYEEIGVVVDNLEKFGIIDFEFPNSGEISEVHFFCAKEFNGEPRESEEMRPEWFHINEIPLDQMWDDDKYWFPLFLEGKKFKGRISFDENDNVIDKELNIINRTIL